MGLSDATARPRPRLWFPSDARSRLAAGPPCQASQVPDGSVCARCLLSPRRVPPLLLVEASGVMRASPLLGGWPLSFKLNGADSSSLNATARAFAASGFNRQDFSRPSRIWLHGFRPFTMMNTSQFTRTTKLSWRTRRMQRQRRGRGSVQLSTLNVQLPTSNVQRSTFNVSTLNASPGSVWGFLWRKLLRLAHDFAPMILPPTEINGRVGC